MLAVLASAATCASSPMPQQLDVRVRAPHPTISSRGSSSSRASQDRRAGVRAAPPLTSSIDPEVASGAMTIRAVHHLNCATMCPVAGFLLGGTASARQDGRALPARRDRARRPRARRHRLRDARRRGHDEAVGGVRALVGPTLAPAETGDRADPRARLRPDRRPAHRRHAPRSRSRGRPRRLPAREGPPPRARARGGDDAHDTSRSASATSRRTGRTARSGRSTPRTATPGAACPRSRGCAASTPTSASCRCTATRAATPR